MENLSNKGYTLVEVIVSIAIISMLIIVILTFQTSSLTLISKEGSNTNELFNAQKVLDFAISNNYFNNTDGTYSDTSWGTYIVKVSTESVDMKISEISKETIQGKLLEVINKENNKSILYTFIPN